MNEINTLIAENNCITNSLIAENNRLNINQNKIRFEYKYINWLSLMWLKMNQAVHKQFGLG